MMLYLSYIIACCLLLCFACMFISQIQMKGKMMLSVMGKCGDMGNPKMIQRPGWGSIRFGGFPDEDPNHKTFGLADFLHYTLSFVYEH